VNPKPGAIDRGYIDALHYPDGYRVEVVGGRVISGARSDRLVVRAHRSAEEVTVRVTRPGAVGELGGVGLAPGNCRTDDECEAAESAGCSHRHDRDRRDRRRRERWHRR